MRVALRRAKCSLRILSLNTSPGFEDSALWQATAVAVTNLDPMWNRRSLLGKAWNLLSLSRSFDVLLFHLDLRLAAVYGLFRQLVRSRQCLVFESFLCDISRYSTGDESISSALRSSASLILHRLLVRSMDGIIVHSRVEIDLYSNFFGAPRSRFLFVPYFHYGNARDYPTSEGVLLKKDTDVPTILAIGRHRDFGCFIRAMSGSPWSGVIVAGDSDRAEISGTAPPNVAVRYEVSRAEYRDYISQSTIVVIPLYANRWQRALGQIAMFEAMLMSKPVIAARTFQLADYASEDEILYYQPGDSSHLRDQISRVLEDSELSARLTGNARKRVLTEFTRDSHVVALLSSLAYVCDRRGFATTQPLERAA